MYAFAGIRGMILPPYHTIPYHSFNNVADMRNVQQIHIQIEIKWVNVKYN